MDKWLPRRAMYSGIFRGLQAILITGACLSESEAKAITPHSFRHFLVGPARQLHLKNVVTAEGIEAMGHWQRGSAMPNVYDASSGVTELSTKVSVLGALSDGWCPTKQGEVVPDYVVPASHPGKVPSWHVAKCIIGPAKQPPRPLHGVGFLLQPLVVAHTRRKKLHTSLPFAGKTVCKWWSCGTIEAPSSSAIFGDCVSDIQLIEYDWCRHCKS